MKTSLSILKLVTIACTLLVLWSCLQSKTSVTNPTYFDSWKDDNDRIRMVKEYAKNYHMNDIVRAARETKLPVAVIFTLLTIERYNDWKVNHAMNAYQSGDLVFKLSGGKRSLGPANVGLSAVQYIYDKHKSEYFKNGLTPEGVYLKLVESEYNSIYWGSVYLKTIYDDVLANDPDKLECKRWVKAIGLYNEGPRNAKNFACGDYSTRVNKVLTEAFREF